MIDIFGDSSPRGVRSMDLGWKVNNYKNKITSNVPYGTPAKNCVLSSGVNELISKKESDLTERIHLT